MSPRSGRIVFSTTRACLLGGDPVKVLAKLSQIDRGGVAEHGHGGIRADEAVPAKWRQFPHRDAIAGHDERLAVVELPHNLAAIVAEFTLRDLSGHTAIVARRATVVNADQRVVPL